MPLSLWLARNYPALKERSGASAALITEHGFAFWEAHGDLYRGWFQVEKGAADSGIFLIDASLAASELPATASGCRPCLPFTRRLVRRQAG